jgi:MFS family permease
VKNYDMSDLNGTVAEIICRLWLTRVLLWHSVSASTLNLIGIMMEKYLKIVHPIKHKLRFSSRVAYGMMGVAWLLWVTMSLVPILTSGMVNGYCYQLYFWPSPAWQKVVGFIIMVLMFLMPLLLLLYGYSHIIFVLRRKQPADGEGGSDNITVKSLKKVVKVLVLVSISFVACWILNYTLFFLFNLSLWMDFEGPLYHMSTALAFINCCVNPFIYAATYDEFR